MDVVITDIPTQQRKDLKFFVAPEPDEIKGRNKEKFKGIYTIKLEVKDNLDNLKQFQEETNLENFRVDAILSTQNDLEVGQTLEDKVNNASQVYIVRGGWCSDKETLLQLANDILKVDSNGVVLMLDHPGQSKSGFIDSANIEITDEMASLEFLNSSVNKGMDLLGVGRENLLEKGKKVVEIYHSRSGAAGLLQVSDNPDVKQLFLAPVFGHEGIKPTIARRLLPVITLLGKVIYNNMPVLSESIADPIRNLLIAAYSGKEHKEILPLYEYVFRYTDKKVLAKFFYNLTQVKMKEFPKNTFDPKRHRVVVYGNDNFVDPDGMKAELQRTMGDKAVSECVSFQKGDHHAFLDDPEANKNVIDFVAKN